MLTYHYSSINININFILCICIVLLRYIVQTNYNHCFNCKKHAREWFLLGHIRQYKRQNKKKLRHRVASARHIKRSPLVLKNTVVGWAVLTLVGLHWCVKKQENVFVSSIIFNTDMTQVVRGLPRGRHRLFYPAMSVLLMAWQRQRPWYQIQDYSLNYLWMFRFQHHKSLE